MDLNENLTQYLKLLGKELWKRERFWYRERFGFKLQFKAKRSYTTDGQTELVIKVICT